MTIVVQEYHTIDVSILSIPIHMVEGNQID